MVDIRLTIITASIYRGVLVNNSANQLFYLGFYQADFHDRVRRKNFVT